MPSAQTPNSYLVPRKQWKKWPEASRIAFNHMYALVAHNQELFSHPRQEHMPDEHWQTTAWNVSWEAADMVNKDLLQPGSIVEWVTPRGEEVARPYKVR